MRRESLMKINLITVSIICFVLSVLTVNAQVYESRIGIQTWTLRNLSFEQVVAFAVKNKIKYLEMMPRHLDPNAPLEEMKRKKKILDENGVVCYTIAASFTLDKAQNRKVFEFAKFMGMKLITTEPQDFKILDNLEELAKEYDIKIAIHNHGIKSLYGNPKVLQNLLKYRDSRIGVCLDVGHLTGAGFDAEKVFRDYGARVFDIHLKDVKVTYTKKGQTITDVFIGTGDVNFKGLFSALRETNYAGVLAIETENDLKDAAAFVQEAVKFVEENKP